MGSRRGPYSEDFPVGTRVRIKPIQALTSFQSTWGLHNPLQDDQLSFAGETADVESVGFYHGGDELYVLVGVEGLWHEQCLEAVECVAPSLTADIQFRTWPSIRRRLKLSLLWFCVSVVTAPFGWGLAGALMALLVAESPGDAVREALIWLIAGPLFATAVVLAFAGPYLVVFLAWPWCVRHIAFIERTRHAIVATAFVLSLPPALVVAQSRAVTPAGLDHQEFVSWFAMASMAGALAILLPRMFLRALRPGVFLADPGPLRFAADDALAFARPAELKPRTLASLSVSTDRDEAPEQSYRRALAAFDGARVPLGRPDRMVFSTVASDAGADTRIDASGFTVRWPQRREPFSYCSWLGPAVVATLRQHAPGESFAKPFTLDGPTLSRLGFFGGGPRWFWVSRTPDAITIACRVALASTSPPPMPAPLPPAQPAEKNFAKYDPPRACRHCGAFPERYRLVDGVLICLACGRSDRITEEERREAVLEHAG